MKSKSVKIFGIASLAILMLAVFLPYTASASGKVRVTLVAHGLQEFKDAWSWVKANGGTIISVVTKANDIYVITADLPATNPT